MSDTQVETAGADIAEFAEELAAVAEDAVAMAGDADRRRAEQGGGVEAAVSLDMIMRIPVVMKVVLGGAQLPVATLSKMKRGEVIKLDRRAGEPADIVVNGRTLARGKVILVDEATGQLGISITEIVGGAVTR